MAMSEKSAQPIKRVRRTARSGSIQQTVQTTTEAVEEAVVSARQASRSFAWRSASNRDVIAFLRQLILLLEAGTPLLKALRILSGRGRSGAIRALVGDIASSVESGTALWQAFERHPHEFETVFVNMVKASEASGNLVPVLKRLADHREHRALIKRKVQFALVYPIVVFVACAAVIILMSTYVVPAFEDMFAKLQHPLPWYTQDFIAFTNFIRDFWLWGLVALFGLGVIYKIAVLNPTMRYVADYCKLKIPVVGGILQGLSIVEMTRGLSMLLKSGMSMLVTLDLVRNTISNRAVANSLIRVRDSVESGGGFEEPLRRESGVVPPVVTDMLVTGEESGQIDKIAEHIANTYDEEVNMRVNALGEFIQPVITVIIGGFVLALALVLFVPLVDMVQSLGSTSGGGGDGF
jgi:type IV pilus assembly protein PilC